MASLEQIVRPFVAVSVAPAYAVPPSTGSPTKPPEDVVLRMGLGGSGKIISGSNSVKSASYMDGKVQEISAQKKDDPFGIHVGPFGMESNPFGLGAGIGLIPGIPGQ